MAASFQKLFSSRSAIGYVKDPVSTTLPVFLSSCLPPTTSLEKTHKQTNKQTNTKTNKMGRFLPQQFGKLWLYPKPKIM
jgi:hypothetical protein